MSINPTFSLSEYKMTTNKKKGETFQAEVLCDLCLCWKTRTFLNDVHRRVGATNGIECGRMEKHRMVGITVYYPKD